MSQSSLAGTRQRDGNDRHQDYAKAPSEQGEEVEKENSVSEENCATFYEEIPEMDHQGWRRHYAALAA